MAKGKGTKETKSHHIRTSWLHTSPGSLSSTNQTKFSQGKGLKRTRKWLMASYCENPTNGDVLQQERSQCQLKEHEREVWNYNWHVEIKETRKRAKVTEHLQQLFEAQNEQPPTQSTSPVTDFSKMTIYVLQNELKQKCQKVSVRKQS